MDNCCKEKMKWGEKRAIILSKPENVIEGECGQIIFADIEVQNQTKWPWKRGCFLAFNGNKDECPLSVKDFLIDQDMKGMQTLKLSIPIQIPEDFQF